MKSNHEENFKSKLKDALTQCSVVEVADTRHCTCQRRIASDAINKWKNST